MAKSVDGKCGHVNKHSRGTNGQLDDLPCEKPQGHDGNHGAFHLQYVNNDSGLVIIGKKKYTEDKVWCEWTDAAGVLASEIKPQELPISEFDAERSKFIKSFIGGDLPKGTIVG